MICFQLDPIGFPIRPTMIGVVSDFRRPRLNFVVQHLLGLKEALIGCFVAMS